LSTFADSSALVKLYADEPDHELVRVLEVLVVSALARIEVPAAIWRKLRLGQLSAGDAQVLVNEFEADLFGDERAPARFNVVGLPLALLDLAARLVAVHGLRAYDAVQLATGLAVREADPSCAAFACFDGTLRRAAAAEGFSLVP
jgi:predicted nucleic acid-binding protein